MPPGIRVVALGGSTRTDSAGERALRIAAASAESAGADVTYFTGRDLILPIYDTETSDRSPMAVALVEALRSADGVLLCSPGYHGSISGMVKNALDYAEDLRHDERPYLDGRAVGCIAVAHGWQTTVGTMNQLRQVAHALRAWPTPLGCALNDSLAVIGSDAGSTDPSVAAQLQMVGRQVVDFATAFKAVSGD
jgi:FMN reductase